jgi:ligand-binding sensor domain-containing protein
MHKWIINLLLLIGICTGLNAQLQLGPTGSWRAHFSNTSIQQIIKGDQLYVAAENQIIAINANQELAYLNATNGLHSIGIHKIGWNPLEQQLIIAYKNGRVDIVQDDQVTLIDDIELTNLFSNKTINDLLILNNKAYLSCSFGIVVIDLIKKEIKETIYPNNARQVIPVLQTVHFNNKTYALTEQDVWSTNLDQNIGWEKENLHGITGLQKMFIFKNQLYFATKQVVYAFLSKDPVFQINSGSIQAITADQEQVYAVTEEGKKGMLIQLNSNKVNTLLLDSTILERPISLLKEGNTIWIADLNKGLYQKNEQSKWVALGGPLSTVVSRHAVTNNQLLISYGENKKGISSFNENGWTNYGQLQNLTLSNIGPLAIDRKDQSWWLGMGVQLINYNPSQNTTTATIPHPNAGVIQSIQQNIDGNIYILKEGLGLLAKEATQWNTYAIPTNYSNKHLKQLIVGANGLSWITSTAQQGILLFQKQNNQTFWKQLNTGKGSGNLPSMDVSAIAEDKDGSIWVGTNNGIALFQCGNINEACDAYLPIVQSNGFNGYLFQKETINSICIDGGNRKWIGTNNGAWLISKDGTEVIQNFTTENSPLPSNKVLSITVEPSNGDVFFFTASEIVSYRGQATEAALTQARINIYPNPVAPDYNGPILIKNLVNNALVKITDLNGQLITQIRAIGGQAIWNGLNQYQRKVASGIYLIFVRDDLGAEKAVGKIMITSGN